LNSTYTNNLQDLDDEWRKLPNVRASLPKEFEVTPQSNDDIFWAKLMEHRNILGELEF
jgi:hypothetical protein